MVVVQTELYVANTEPRFPLHDMRVFRQIADTAYHVRSKCLGALEGETQALNENSGLPRSYDLFICRTGGRYELDIKAECLQAAREDPGLFDCLLRPEGPLLERLERGLGKEPELRELAAFYSRPRSKGQGGHVDNADAAVCDYQTLFFAVDDITIQAGGTCFLRNTAELSKTQLDTLCARLKKHQKTGVLKGRYVPKVETVRLRRGQWLTFSLRTVHWGLGNSGFELPRIVGSALFARRGAPDLPHNRGPYELPTPRKRLSLANLRERTATACAPLLPTYTHTHTHTHTQIYTHVHIHTHELVPSLSFLPSLSHSFTLWCSRPPPRSRVSASAPTRRRR